MQLITCVILTTPQNFFEIEKIMNNEEKVEAAKKDAGGDEKLIIKFAWPNYVHHYYYSLGFIWEKLFPPHKE